MTDLPFVSALVQADLPVWEQCLQTEFLQKMENGTLSEDCFKSYLVEDSLYLREYAKIFAWGMTKATTMAAMRTYYSLLSFVQENEDLTRLRYLEQYGLREADIQSLPLRPESRAYLDCMIDAACNGECPRNRFVRDRYGNSGHNYLCEGYARYFSHVAPYMDFMKAELDAGRAPANVMGARIGG